MRSKIDSTYLTKAMVLRRKYSSFAEQFSGFRDDRLVFCNQYKILLDACNEMAAINTENSFIRVAVDERIRQHDASMQEIVTRFTDCIWCGATYGWQKKRMQNK